MPSRRFHKKSRLGCSRCKLRRVKCDNSMPSCYSCTKRGITCDIVERSNLGFEPVAGLCWSSPNTTPLARDCSLFIKTDPNIALLQHYFDTVSFSFTSSPHVLRMWQDTVLAEGKSQPVLWHGVSAVSALHVLSLRPQFSISDWHAALRHHDVALSALRQGILDPTPANCTTTLLLAMFVSTFVFALPRVIPSQDPLEELAQMAGLMTGMSAFLATTRPWLVNSGVRQLKHLNNSEIEDIAIPGADAALERLYRWNRESAKASETGKLCDAAICALEKRFRAFTSNEDNPGMALVWLCMIPREYISELRRREPMALVIAAHFGVLIHARTPWWIGTRGRDLVKAVAGVLGQQWTFALEWPMEAVGLTSDKHSG